jgi:predicted nucleic acid-binding protein
MILVDTSVLIDFFKGQKNNPCQKFELILNQSVPFGINSFIFQEVLQGAKSDREYRILKKYLETQRFYKLNDPVESFARAARIYFDCKKKGITIRSTIDCLIAQTALEHDLFLLHNDTDFDAMASVIRLKIY